MLHRVALLSLAWLASGCVANSYCLDEQAYSKAESVPPLVGTDTLKLPPSATALRIPSPPEKSVPYGEAYIDEEGDERGRCLDLPPAMAALEPQGPGEAEGAGEEERGNPKSPRKQQKPGAPKPKVPPAPNI